MPRKGENIYKRKDGRWEARYIHHYENGKARYRSVYGASYSEVKAKRLEELAKPENLRVSAVKQLATLNEICTLWLNNRKSKVKESTFTRYVRIVNKYILPGFDSDKLKIIGKQEIQSFLYRLKESLSIKTVSDIKCVFLSIWTLGREQGYPCCEVNLGTGKLKSQQRVCVIPPETQKKFKSTALKYNDSVGLGIIFTLFTGVRIGELCGLRWNDIDFDNSTVQIRRTVERIADLSPSAQKTKVIISEPKTENAIRTIPLPKDLIEYLAVYKHENDMYFLTGTAKYTEPHTYYMRYKNFLKKHKLGDYTFHQLRHTFATECVDKGFDVKSLSEILGHADISTTMNLYVHPTLQMKKRQMDMLSFPSYSPSK